MTRRLKARGLRIPYTGTPKTLTLLPLTGISFGITHHPVRHGVGFGSLAEGPPEKALRFFNSLLQSQRERVPHNPLVCLIAGATNEEPLDSGARSG
jgi:hypothetical protein